MSYDVVVQDKFKRNATDYERRKGQLSKQFRSIDDAVEEVRKSIEEIRKLENNVWIRTEESVGMVFIRVLFEKRGVRHLRTIELRKHKKATKEEIPELV